MDQHTLSFAAYWRSALADAALGRGGLKKADVGAFIERPSGELGEGHLADACVEQLFQDEGEDVRHIEVVLRPRVLIQKVAHGHERASGKPPYLMPLYGAATLSRSGRLCPSGKVVVPRDLLEPLERPAYAIGTIDALDVFLTRNPPPVIVDEAEPQRPADEKEHRKRWRAYLDFCDELLRAVADDWAPVDDGYIDAGCWYVAKARSAGGAGSHILGLYDHLALARPASPLFARYAGAERAAPLPCLPDNAALAGRLGHPNNTNPLTKAQRDSLSHLLAGGDGDIACVNGPPGTGKTTLLLSVVATLWVRAALAGGEPPVIVAASTNNQAVTNIIDAFGKDFAAGDGALAGRWLPAISSFGAYFPSQKKEAELAAKYQTRAFFDAVEDAKYVAAAEAAYLERARAAFPDAAPTTVAAAVDLLRQRMQTYANLLTSVETGRNELDAARAAAREALGDDPAGALGALRARQAANEADLLAARRLRERWEDYLAGESIWLTLFSWLPAVARKRQRLALRCWQSLHPQHAPAPAWRKPEDAEALLAARITDVAADGARLSADIASGEALVDAERLAAQEWQAVAAALGVDGAAPSVDDCDRALDTGARFEMFRLAVHYWEGRWLQEMKPLLPELDKERKKTGRVAVAARWRRRMKLTPCSVSTFFMLPSIMKVARKDAAQFVPDYLYNFIDLLIVDEAGQVLPEVAGASFALARAALVIGDTMQIEPIWSNPRHVDVGNLIGHGLLDAALPGPGYRLIADSGKAAASGSVMRIAQYASPYRYDADLSPGLYLYEHWRCYDPIIDYCNALCYKGKLLPRRGAPRAGAPALPPMGYLHIDGMCRKSQGGSSFNTLEADTIAQWLAANRAQLEARYGKPLREVVGVVSPFSAQVAAIDKACRALSLMGATREEELTIGTVHALQGAERPVIIFSPTYSKHLDGRFIDASASMLNVAVSRAKDSFLVFGDMDVMELSPPSSPRGLLAGYLFRHADNALRFDPAARDDLAADTSGVAQLRDAAEHDAFLLDVLARARGEVRIVTPWLKARAVRRPELWTALLAAVRRGVDVRIYTDEKFNTDAEEQHPAGAGESWRELLDQLEREGMRAAAVGRIHSKIVAADLEVYCVGSFNWFSAARGGDYALHETSLVYRGPALRREIAAVFDSLEKRVVRERR